MIVNLILNIIVLFLGGIFSWLPAVTTLPTINGYNIDAFMVQGVGSLQTLAVAFWPLAIMFQGFLAIMGYFLIKMVVKFFLGSRAG